MPDILTDDKGNKYEIVPTKVFESEVNGKPELSAIYGLKRITPLPKKTEEAKKYTHSLQFQRVSARGYFIDEDYQFTESQGKAVGEAIKSLMFYLTNPVVTNSGSIPNYEVDFHRLELKAVAARQALQSDGRGE